MPLEFDYTNHDTINTLEFQYYSLVAANPDWDESLFDYLLDMGITPDDLANHYPDFELEGHDA